MPPPSRVEPRQLWNLPTSTGARTFEYCTPFVLPPNGIVALNPTSTITLAAEATFVPACSTDNDVNAFDGVTISSITDLKGPFHASITPQVYATAAATCIAWMLVIMLIITPRTFHLSGPQATSGLRGRNGLISGARGGASVIGVGSRPWLQKIAALTVAVSLTIATADTFKVAEHQYRNHYMDAVELRDKVVLSLDIRVSRIVSDIFLWLAQVQTLIRLFSRHKEKVIIKWVGFALIVLDVTFSILNSLLGNPAGRPRAFVNAIPALTYLFQLALSMLYAAWVLYYAATKKRYAFYHPLMWNMSVVALLSIVAILTPVVFFITDISDMSVAGWGDYFRWVGAAAASVVVWEWVERIEVLEREEKKDGILGREVFDGDEMLDVTPSAEVSWPRRRFQRFDLSKGGKGEDSGAGTGAGKTAGGGGGGGGGGFASGLHGYRFPHMGHRFGRRQPQPAEGVAVVPLGRLHSPSNGPKSSDSGSTRPEHPDYIGRPTPPQATTTPVSRADTMSATSTVYTVQYHPVSEAYSQVNGQAPAARGADTSEQQRRRNSRNDGADGNLEPELSPQVSHSDSDLPKKIGEAEAQAPPPQTSRSPPRWHDRFNPFKRRHVSPPVELRTGRVIEPLKPDSDAVLAIRQAQQNRQSQQQTPRVEQQQQQQQSPQQQPQQPQQPITNYSIWDWRSRLGALAVETTEKLRDRSSTRQVEQHLPVTVIPAQPRGRTWSPELLEKEAQQTRREQKQKHQQRQPGTGNGRAASANPAEAATASTSQGPLPAADAVVGPSGGPRSGVRSTPPQLEVTSPSPESVQVLASGPRDGQQRQSVPSEQSLSPTSPRPQAAPPRPESARGGQKADGAELSESKALSPTSPGG